MPLPTPTDDDIDDVREVAGENSTTFIEPLIDNLNDAKWAKALDFVTAWREFPPGSVMRLENGGREGVFDSELDALEDIRRRMRLLLGLPELRDTSLTGGFGSTSVPTLWVW